MNFCIRPSETFEIGIKGVINKQVNGAINSLRGEEDIHEGIHDFRMRFKIIRSIYRLLRFEIGNKLYRRINAFYRDESKRLSFLRDLTAMIETLEMLHRTYPLILNDETILEATEMLEHLRTEATLSENQLANLVACTVETFGDEINLYPVNIKKENIVKGVTHVYARGYRAFQANYPKASAEVNHEWRKRAKYLRYQFHLLTHAWKRVFVSLEKELHTLTDLLGDYNNLVVLKSHLVNSEMLQENNRKLLWQIAHHHQSKLHREAFLLGQKLYSDSPSIFASRMDHQIQVWWKHPLEVTL